MRYCKIELMSLLREDFEKIKECSEYNNIYSDNENIFIEFTNKQLNKFNIYLLFGCDYEFISKDSFLSYDSEEIAL